MIEFEQKVKEKWQKWRYRNTCLSILSIAVFFYFIESPLVQFFLTKIGALGYFGAFVSGMMFVSIFTIAPSSVILFDLANSLNPIAIAVVASVGAAVGDYIIFRYLKDNVFAEIAPLFKLRKRSILRKLFSSPYFSWALPIIGAAMIALPIPDEIGISIIGVSKIKTWQFLLLTFSLNIVAIYFAISLAVNF